MEQRWKVVKGRKGKTLLRMVIRRRKAGCEEAVGSWSREPVKGRATQAGVSVYLASSAG
jgi:hypothetical protein